MKMNDPVSAFDDLTLAAAKRGDMSAWNRIYRHLEKPMYSLALSMVRNPAEAEDLVQEAFIKVMNKIHQFRGDSSLWGWVRQILANQCISHLRNARRWDGNSEQEIELLLDQVENDAQWGAEKDIRRVMERLPEQAQRVVYLYVVEGMTHKEIAEMFALTESFSKSTVSRSLKQLKSWISPK
ncbi:RNA polymerase sigma factor [Pleionea sp. CnH1-48]|uniref:RNA polymerase sigma factor n=1 Tax=Pleionea sp. CnH1-48 TaxID=2954494 RepID=UPI002097DA2C|nr:RNA polymerase sigma factor [Pleionea sp. CnH1-48]MCO7224837.1 RNA polymerase sigma factor [Pleionea sp. CnH1-48]